jgi:hypothetical protein
MYVFCIEFVNLKKIIVRYIRNQELHICVYVYAYQYVVGYTLFAFTLT